MIDRVARWCTWVAAVAVLAAGLHAADLQHDRRRAPMVLYAVPESTATAHLPGAWDSTVFLAVLGSDGRPGLEGERADALHVIGYNPALGAGTILNIPRDTWVEIPGYGQGRVNEAFRHGGPALQAETLRRLTGAPIRYVLTTTFGGLENMVDRLGGVEVDVPYPMNDRNSGAVFGAGRQRLGGAQALAFSRNRHIPGGDLSRTAHQGQLLLHGLAELRRQGTSGIQALGYLEALYRNVRVEGVGPSDLYRLARTALGVDPAAVRNYTIPAVVGMRGRQSVVFLRQPQATALFVDFVDDAVLQGH